MHLIQRVLSISKGEPVFLSKFKDCFRELGTLLGYYQITMDQKVIPIINPPRKVLFALKKKLKQELQRKTHFNIFVSENEPTIWVSSLVVLEKPNGTLRVCLDPRNLTGQLTTNTNWHISRNSRSTVIHQAGYLSCLLVNQSGWKSSKLLTFNSPCSRFRFQRIPYGIHGASAVCQARIATIIGSIEWCRNAQNDIIIWADTPELLEKEQLKFCKLSGGQDSNWIDPSVNLTSVNWYSSDTQYPIKE